MAMISAQPILWPFLCQPGCNFQASQLSPKIMPMPQEDEASTQNSIGKGGGGLAKEEPQKSDDNWVRHQLISESTLGLGNLRVKGEGV